MSIHAINMNTNECVERNRSADTAEIFYEHTKYTNNSNIDLTKRHDTYIISLP